MSPIIDTAHATTRSPSRLPSGAKIASTYPAMNTTQLATSHLPARRGESVTVWVEATVDMGPPRIGEESDGAAPRVPGTRDDMSLGFGVRAPPAQRGAASQATRSSGPKPPRRIRPRSSTSARPRVGPMLPTGIPVSWDTCA